MTIQIPNEAIDRQILIVREEQAAGVDGLAPSATSTFDTLILNTVGTNTIAGASVASNQVILPAGDYELEVSVPYNSVITELTVNSRFRVRNITGAADLGLSTSGRTGDSSDMVLLFKDNISLAVTTTIELQGITDQSSGLASARWGTAGSVYAGQPEVYTLFKATKI